MKTIMLMTRKIVACLALCVVLLPQHAEARGNRAITYMQKGAWGMVTWYQNDGACLYLTGFLSSFESTTRMFKYVNPYALTYVSVDIYDVCTNTRYRYDVRDSTELAITAAGEMQARVSGVSPASVCVTELNQPSECHDTSLAIDLRWDAYEDPVQITNSEHDYEAGLGMYSYRFTGSYARALVTGDVLDGDVPLFLAPVRSGELRTGHGNSVTIYSNKP
jgi:hypothetical protein